MNKSIKISGKILSRYKEIISEEALQFIQDIHEQFNSKRLELLNAREKRQKGKSRKYNSWDEDNKQKRKKSNKNDYYTQDWSL